MTPKEQLTVIRRGTERIVPEDELVRKLKKGRALRVKLGVDPTAPDLHLGHTIGLTKMRQLQDLGHQAVLIIGDFTATIGDPSGRSTTRPTLSRTDIERNALTYQEQAFKILDKERCEVRFNSEWFSEFKMADVVALCASYTLARMLEREDFGRRYHAGDPIGLHELLYPLLQGYDSVKTRADIELGGTDQTFNILVGRDLQRDAGYEGQVAVLLPILEGTDGVQKMSKSLGNAIGILDNPRDMFGKIMSISDELMARYDECLRLVPATDRTDLHPMEAKKALARELVERFHGYEAARDAQLFFERRHQQGRPVDPELREVPTGPDGTIWICRLLRELEFARSASEGRRLVAQGAVRLDGAVMKDVDREVSLEKECLVQVGRRRLALVRRRSPANG